jgi:hypothetical protein
MISEASAIRMDELNFSISVQDKRRTAKLKDVLHIIDPQKSTQHKRKFHDVGDVLDPIRPEKKAKFNENCLKSGNGFTNTNFEFDLTHQFNGKDEGETGEEDDEFSESRIQPDKSDLNNRLRDAIGDGLYDDIKNTVAGAGSVNVNGGQHTVGNDDNVFVKLADLSKISSQLSSSNEPQALEDSSEGDAAEDVTSKPDNAEAPTKPEKTAYYIRLRRPHKILTKEMFAQVKVMSDLAMPALRLEDQSTFDNGAQIVLAIIKILAERYAKQDRPPKTKVAQGPYPSTGEEYHERLKGPEEDKHPWAKAQKLPKDNLLRRVMDGASKARCYHGNGIVSQVSTSNFTTREGRHDSIDEHLDYSNRKGTALISCSGDGTDFVENRIRRQDRRVKPEKGDDRELAYINVLSLIADGVPVLCAEVEANHYEVRRAMGAHWIKHEYFVLLKIDVKHIVGTWHWTDVQEYMRKHKCGYHDWEQAIVFRALHEHESARQEGRQHVPKDGCVCCAQHGRLWMSQAPAKSGQQQGE